MKGIVNWSFAVPDRWAMVTTESADDELREAAARLVNEAALVEPLTEGLIRWRGRFLADDIHFGAAWVPDHTSGAIAGVAHVTMVVPDEPLTPAGVRASLASWSAEAAGVWDVRDVQLPAGRCVLGHGFLVAPGSDLGQVEEVVHAVVLPSGTTDALELEVTAPLLAPDSDVLDDVLELLSGLEVELGDVDGL